MSVVTIADYKVISEEATSPEEICRRAYMMLLDMDIGDVFTSRFVSQLEKALEGTEITISFVSTYKDYIIPNNLAGLAIIRWITPSEDDKHFTPTDFCFPLFIGRKDLPEFENSEAVIEEWIRIEAEAKQYAYELKESLKL